MLLEDDSWIDLVERGIVFSICCGWKKGKKFWLEKKVYEFVFVKIIKEIDEEFDFEELFESGDENSDS